MIATFVKVFMNIDDSKDLQAFYVMFTIKHFDVPCGLNCWYFKNLAGSFVTDSLKTKSFNSFWEKLSDEHNSH